MDASPSAHGHDRLRQARIERNWRQQDLADHLGTTVVTSNAGNKAANSPVRIFA